MKKCKSLLVLIFLAVLLLTACEASGPQMRVEDAWIRPDPLWENAAGYFTLFNDGGESDTLLGVSIAISDSESLHQTVMDGDVHKMLPVEKLEIAPGESVTFEPMSYHVMVMELDSGLDYGQTVSMIFEFEKSGEIETQAEIRSE